MVTGVILPRIPSLRIEATPIQGGKERELDLAAVRAVLRKTEGDYLLSTPCGYFKAKPEFHQSLAEYVDLHYAKLGDELWANPTGLQHVDHNVGRGSLHYSSGGDAVLVPSFAKDQMAALIRRAGLVGVGMGVFVSVGDMLGYNAAEWRGRFFGSYFWVDAKSQGNMLNILEASDWLAHKDGSWSNPEQVRLLKGQEIVFSADYSLPLEKLNPVAEALARALPWVQIDEGVSVNLNAVQGIGPRDPDNSEIVVSMGAGLEHTISRTVNGKIVAALVGFPSPRQPGAI